MNDFFLKMTEKKINLVLILDTSGDDDECDHAQIIDVKSITPLGDHHYLIKTVDFNDASLSYGAGDEIPSETLKKLIHKMKSLYSH